MPTVLLHPNDEITEATATADAELAQLLDCPAVEILELTDQLALATDAEGSYHHPANPAGTALARRYGYNDWQAYGPVALRSENLGFDDLRAIVWTAGETPMGDNEQTITITILRRNGNYVAAYRDAANAMADAHRKAVAYGQIREDTEVTWESDGDPRPGHETWWMWTGQHATGWTIGHDQLR